LHADSLINNAHFSKSTKMVARSFRCHWAEQVQFHFLENRFDTRDLGAVLDHEEPLPPSGM
jgi:hypothetical protein